MTLARSSLGHCISSWLKDKGHLLLALESYFDGSRQGDWRDGSLVTLAGLAADDSVWADFDKGWKLVLENGKDRPKARYLHMREAVPQEGEFNFRNGWNRKKVIALVHDALQFLSTIDKKRFRQFACTIDLVAHRKLRLDGYILDDPISICVGQPYGCPSVVLAWYATDYPGLIHSAQYFFDQGEPFREEFEKEWIQKKQNLLDATGMTEFWSVIKTVTTADMRDKPALQCADMLAWASNRIHSQDSEAKVFRYLERLMKAVIPSSWIVLDEEKLRGLALGKTKP